MPSGFETVHDGILKAIINATSNGEKPVLIFASPSNWSNTREVAFPGRLYKHGRLISMFSTTSRNKPTPEFNPAPSSPGRYNLAIFGERVIIPPDQEPLDGTSVSTMIGAGLAGRILSFAHHPDNADKIPSLSHLRLTEGMSSVFKAMSFHENGYDCVQPELLLPPDHVKSDTGVCIERVRETIRTQLDNLYR